MGSKRFRNRNKPAPNYGEKGLVRAQFARWYFHPEIDCSKYRPHQGAKECARRVKNAVQTGTG